METENTGTPHPDSILGEGDMDTGDNGAPPCPDDSTQQSSTPAQRNQRNSEATTVSCDVHTPSSTCGPSTTSSAASSLGSESRRKPLSLLTEFLTLPNYPTPKSSKPKKNSEACVLTSANAIAMMEESKEKGQRKKLRSSGRGSERKRSYKRRKKNERKLKNSRNERQNGRERQKRR